MVVCQNITNIVLLKYFQVVVSEALEMLLRWYNVTVLSIQFCNPYYSSFELVDKIKNRDLKTFLFKKNTYNRLSKKSCGIFIEFSIVHKIGYNNAI